MFANRELTCLLARKAELLAESDALRQGLAADWQKVQPIFEWVQTGIGFVRQTKPLFLAGVPLLGILAARKRRSTWGLAAKLSLGWQMWRAMAATRNANQVERRFATGLGRTEA